MATISKVKKNSKRKAIERLLEDSGAQSMILEGFDDCIIGINNETYSVCYDASKIIESLVNNQGVTYSEAEEFFSFNIEGSKVSDGNPTYIDVL